MKCLKIERLAISSDEPVLPNRPKSPPVLKMFVLFIFVGFFAAMGVAAYKYKSESLFLFKYTRPNSYEH